LIFTGLAETPQPHQLAVVLGLLPRRRERRGGAGVHQIHELGRGERLQVRPQLLSLGRRAGAGRGGRCRRRVLLLADVIAAALRRRQRGRRRRHRAGAGRAPVVGADAAGVGVDRSGSRGRGALDGPR